MYPMYFIQNTEKYVFHIIKTKHYFNQDSVNKRLLRCNIFYSLNKRHVYTYCKECMGTYTLVYEFD